VKEVTTPVPGTEISAGKAHAMSVDAIRRELTPEPPRSDDCELRLAANDRGSEMAASKRAGPQHAPDLNARSIKSADRSMARRGPFRRYGTPVRIEPELLIDLGLGAGAMPASARRAAIA